MANQIQGLTFEIGILDLLVIFVVDLSDQLVNVLDIPGAGIQKKLQARDYLGGKMPVHFPLDVVNIRIDMLEDLLVITAENGNPDLGPLHVSAGLHSGDGNQPLLAG
jgi:hypothetical protein